MGPGEHGCKPGAALGVVCSQCLLILQGSGWIQASGPTLTSPPLWGCFHLLPGDLTFDVEASQVDGQMDID